MSNFADKLISRFIETKSVLTVGIDPALDSLPKFISREVEKEALSNEDYVYKVLTQTFIPSLEALSQYVAATKPNIAFFEQYGIAGLRAYADILQAAKTLKVPSIVDAKRGDIGSTAAAYAAAFLGGSSVRSQKYSAFECDALTVNPYLGADTLEVFAEACERYEKGLFVLVRTSNPGSKWLQAVTENGQSVANKVADWVFERGQTLVGNKGFSSLGAVVGATYPAEAKELRAIMKNNIFLIPGFGAQGGAASDAVAGFSQPSLEASAATVNVSRGLFSVFSQDLSNIDEMQKALIAKAQILNSELNAELVYPD